MARARKPSREDVLNAYSVEPDRGRATLERYLRKYPEYGEALVDLSYELNLEVRESALSERDEALIEAAWHRHSNAGRTVDLLAGLTTDELRDVAKALNVPRQVITAFRERAIIIASVPKPFLARFAKTLGAKVDALVISLQLPPAAALARSFKADGRPTPTEQMTFERVLIDAGVSEEDRAKLLSAGG